MQRNRKIAILLGVLLLIVVGVVGYFEFFHQPPTKYSCELNKCVADANGMYDEESSCNVNCLTSEYICDIEGKKCSTTIPDDYGDKPIYENLDDCNTMCGWKKDDSVCTFVNESGVSPDESTCQEGLTYYYNPQTNKCGLIDGTGFEAAGLENECEKLRHVYLDPQTNKCSPDNSNTGERFDNIAQCLDGRQYIYSSVTNSCKQIDRPTDTTDMFSKSDDCLNAKARYYLNKENICSPDSTNPMKKDSSGYDSKPSCDADKSFVRSATADAYGYINCTKDAVASSYNVEYTKMAEECLKDTVWFSAGDCRKWPDSNCGGVSGGGGCESADTSECAATSSFDPEPDKSPTFQSTAMTATSDGTTTKPTLEDDVKSFCGTDTITSLENPSSNPAYKCSPIIGCTNGNRVYTSPVAALYDCFRKTNSGKCDTINVVPAKDDAPTKYYLRDSTNDVKVLDSDPPYIWGNYSIQPPCKGSKK